MEKPANNKTSPLTTPTPQATRIASPEEEQEFKSISERVKKEQQEAFDRDGMEIRTYILHVAISLEHLISNLLGELLEITVNDSHVIGYRANPISFNQKVWLLIEIGAIKDEASKDFQSFMEIRNMLLHNLEARSLKDCFQMIEHKSGNGLSNKVLRLADTEIPKMYKANQEWTIETRLNLGLRMFIDQVSKQAQEAIVVLGEKTLEKTRSNALRNHHDRIMREIINPSVAHAREVLHGSKLSFTREEVGAILQSVGYQTSELYRATYNEEVLKALNALRVRTGLEPLTEIPMPSEFSEGE